jgi:hypothetical protein
MSGELTRQNPYHTVPAGNPLPTDTHSPLLLYLFRGDT